jgi:hypothetical protein
MRIQRYQLVLIAALIVALVIIFFAGRTWGVSSTNFWLVVLVTLGLPGILMYIFLRYKRNNEIIQCGGCQRTMIYSVFQKAGGCPKCHSHSFTRTGTWPKA